MIYFNINKWIFMICIMLFIANVQSRETVTNGKGDECLIERGDFNGTVGIINFGGYVFIGYSCEKNYTLIGHPRDMCFDNYVHKVLLKFCKLTTTFNCPPFKYKNAEVTFYNNGNLAEINCNPNYYYNKTNELGRVDKFRNNFELKCVNGSWTENDFNSCQPITL
ncbi:uncharacterized protein LOC127291221 [Leptopilina boulardi]|uniref:uncharacterized protein LOC127291221 n=1 Tax=Leptopilina boulardi TaxID=63433 RepID=UPI0021F68681|nr:uncharacterized protein LOC127286786 isoform X3 [Leptopilina boulardi]XP_051169323.1 uncharacterized protein LOC127286786 isoform X3 [Leptopilina boulardi]XP_051169324.1 uncharacterized protein LOC127286786 isoform X3 [Leptopilina boulardi]XP_051176158.1 uncharacterized protein LOC127291221 [Leptopilina boulardi]